MSSGSQNLFKMKWHNNLQITWVCLIVIYIWRETDREREICSPFFHSAAHFSSAHLAKARIMFPNMLKSVAFAWILILVANTSVMGVLNTLFRTVALFGLSSWVWKLIQASFILVHLHCKRVWIMLVNVFIPLFCKQAGERGLVQRPRQTGWWQSSLSALTFVTSGWII